ncbi:hypothetical protein NL676_022255 [Syzygium grande]|nr:hypothetical protein NL676_022255 [Syzygium grande]
MLMTACKPALESMNVTKVIHDCKRDSEIAYHPLEEQEGRKRLPDDCISFVSLLADPRCGGISYLEEEEVRILLMQDPKMMEKLNAQSLRYLAVGSALYCRCFCINDNNYAHWPSLPPIPAENALEEEILCVLDVPPGKMGRVIGRRGASIMSVKESCNAEILIGGAKGPPDKFSCQSAPYIRCNVVQFALGRNPIEAFWYSS